MAVMLGGGIATAQTLSDDFNAAAVNESASNNANYRPHASNRSTNGC
ncbi:hypothetical protein J2X72_004376 [Phyllobacterium sp. 1468]|nr:hypothetical protein [Phyllobacterium sp. 1468]